MNIFILKQPQSESRVTIIPQDIKKLCQLETLVWVEKDIGASLFIEDKTYEQYGAKVLSRKEGLANADMVLSLRKPSLEDSPHYKKGAIHIGFLDPFNSQELLESMKNKGVTLLSLEFLPRITLAQKMDILSSQANLAGYLAVILAAEKLPKIFPMMITPAGTIKPAKVFIIGAGVAGLQAIATAKRLGAKVDAFDTRPPVEEQVRSLGAKFLKIDLGETGQTEGGYAKVLTSEQLKKQQEAISLQCQQSDIVITTAQVFGKKAPTLVTKATLSKMQKGSVVVDLAVESGGNVEGVEEDKISTLCGVTLIGLYNLPGKVAIHASQLISSNFFNFIEHFWNKQSKNFNLDLDQEILKSCVLTHEGVQMKDFLKK